MTCSLCWASHWAAIILIWIRSHVGLITSLVNFVSSTFECFSAILTSHLGKTKTTLWEFSQIVKASSLGFVCNWFKLLKKVGKFSSHLDWSIFCNYFFTILSYELYALNHWSPIDGVQDIKKISSYRTLLFTIIWEILANVTVISTFFPNYFCCKFLPGWNLVNPLNFLQFK